MSLYVPYYRPYNKHNTNIHVLGGIRTHNPSKRAAADPRLRPRGHWDRHVYTLSIYKHLVRHRENGVLWLERKTRYLK
jgi:hypothetical protein